ncbi:unnamed protein product [Peronospora farinosa]|uniref:RxLR effector protein n=1 Tax=Peronospora farinosa TaxID=134698 RepID=A0ABN8BX18_9STRA|nr:unnamed protein product [Peronospora farinosa]
MRLDSILFVAGLSACINASSTHSISSSAKSIASHQEDVFADGIGVETINEERTLNIPGFDTVVENINLMASSRMVKMLDGKSMFEAYKTLQLHKGIPFRKKRYNTWIGNLDNAFPHPFKTELKVSKDHEEESFLMVLKALIKAQKREDIQGELNKALIEFWTLKKMSSDAVFKLLKLNKLTDYTQYIKLLSMWVDFSKSSDVNMRSAIVHYHDSTRLRILARLSKIMGTEEVVQPLQDSLVDTWNLEKRSAENLFSKLKLLKKGRSDIYFDMWVKYVKQTPSDLLDDIKLAIPKLIGRHGGEGLLKMLDALVKEHVGKDIQGKVESALRTSWKAQVQSADDVFKLLKFDLKPEPNHSVIVNRLRLWIQYVKNDLAMPGAEMTRVIRDYKLDVRVMILGDQVVQVFRELNLQNNLLENPNLNLFYSFAGKFKHEKTEKTSLITAARAVYGDIPLGKMLEAAWRKSTDATATPLLIELFRQWNADTKSHQLDIDNKLEGDLQSSYKAYISAFVKAI